MNPDLLSRDLPMPIKTPRLTIVPNNPEIARAMYEAVVETRDELRDWFPWAMNEPTIESYEKILAKHAESFVARTDMAMAVFDESGRLVAGTGLVAVNNFYAAHIAYWVRSTERGKGYAAEIANALAYYALTVMGLKKVSIHVADENVKSIRVAEKLGFPLEYIARYGTYHPPTNRLRDLNVYSRFDTDGLPALDVSWG